MTKQRAEVIFYIVLSLTGIGFIAFLIWAIYFTVTNPN